MLMLDGDRRVCLGELRDAAALTIVGSVARGSCTSPDYSVF